MAWYYAKSGTSVGPIETEELLRLATTGEITPEALVTSDGGGAWLPFAEAAAGLGLDPSRYASQSVAVATGECANCRRVLPLEQMLRYGDAWVCAECKPAFLQRLKEGLGAPGRLAYAGFWVRFGARAVDGLLLFAFYMLLFLPMMLWSRNWAGENPQPENVAPLFALTCGLQLLQFAGSALYETLFVAKKGATPGKMLFRLRVVRADGSALTTGRAAGRYFATLLSSLTLLIGFVIAAFDEQKRALHDHVADTRVVRA